MKSPNEPAALTVPKVTQLKSGAYISDSRMAAYRSDGWTNILTGLGLGNDKRSAGSLNYTRMNEIDAEILYAGDDMSARIVDLLPDNGIRKWIDYQGMETDVEGQFVDKISDLEVKKKTLEALKWARIYGGAGILLGTDEMDDLTVPMVPENVDNVISLTTMTRYELFPSQLQYDPLKKNFGYPEFYRLQLRGASPINGHEVHHSRIVRFDGIPLPRRLFIQNQYWADSVFSKIYEIIRNFNTSHNSLATVLQDFRVGIFKLKNLAEMIAMGDDGLVQKRLALVDAAKSVARSIVIDAEGEDFHQETGTLTGLKDAYDIINDRMVAACGIPITVLLGRSPQGLGGSGRHEETNWYDMVASYQEDNIRPALKKILEAVAKSKQGPTKGKMPEGFGFTFNPLWQLDEAEQATMRYTQAQADNLYVLNGTVTPEEIALSRFGSEAWDGQTKIDLSMRTEIKPQAQQSSTGEGPQGSSATETQPVTPAAAPAGTPIDQKKIIGPATGIGAPSTTSSGQITPAGGPIATRSANNPNDDHADGEINSGVVKGNLNPPGATVAAVDPGSIEGIAEEEMNPPQPLPDNGQTDAIQTIVISKSHAKNMTQARKMAQEQTKGAEIGSAEETQVSYKFKLRSPGDFLPGTAKSQKADGVDGVTLIIGKLKK